MEVLSDGEVNLAPLQPLSEGMRGILALYAMRANGGCEGSPDPEAPGLQCPLTTALGLGLQCSDQHLGLVKTWFKDGIPPLRLSRKDAAEANRSGSLKWICNSTSDSATNQSGWSSIRMRQEPGGLVTVWGRGYWIHGVGVASGTFANVATYRIVADRVQVVHLRNK
ncbi:MAG TPA: hypothetical protein VHQ90_18415 [Thermoanaerobaculia bacterium]|nr:hypothetical protein [Thermoanaerobaculia bacterium]